MWIIRYPLSPLRQNRTWPTAISASTRIRSSLASSISSLLFHPPYETAGFHALVSLRARLPLLLSSSFFHPDPSSRSLFHLLVPFYFDGGGRYRRELCAGSLPDSALESPARRVNSVRGLVTIEPSRGNQSSVSCSD